MTNTVIKALKLNLIVLFQLFVNFIAFAQNSQFVFHNSSAGISQHSISSIVQDNNGFLWVGTRYGLNRFDGLNFNPYISTQADSFMFINNVINTLMVDVDGNIWVGTNGGGLGFYDYLKDGYVRVPIKKEKYCEVNASVIYAIFQDSKQNIWVGTNSGLYYLKKDAACFLHYQTEKNNPTSLSSNNIASIGEDAEGVIWVGTWANGINRYNKNTDSFIRFDSDSTKGLDNNTVRCLHLSKQGRFLIGTGEGPKEIIHSLGGYEFRDLMGGSSPLVVELNVKRILSISSDASGRIWLGTENEGLFLVEPENKIIKQFKNDPNDEQGLCSNSIWSLLNDDRGILWIGTFNQGLCKLDAYENKFSHLYKSNDNRTSLNNNVISSFAEDKKGNIYVGTEGGGVNYFNRRNNTFTHYMHNRNVLNTISRNNVVCLLMDKNDQLWVGTWEGGLNIKDKNGHGFKQIIHDTNNKNSLLNNDIYDLIEDSKGRIWISCFKAGVDVYLKESKRFIHFTPEASGKRQIASNRIRSILEDEKGFIWLGSEGDGLFKLQLNDSLDIEKCTHYNATNSNLSSNDITKLYQGNSGILWIGTEGAGLNSLDIEKEVFKHISIKQGLTGNIVNAIEQPNDSMLWMSTNEGLSRYNLHTASITNFTASDGLQSTEFYRSSSLLTSSGYLLFGGINGFNLFHPDSISQNPNKPRVYVSSFNLMGANGGDSTAFSLDKNILETKEIELSHAQNNFQLKLSALNYSQSKKNSYAYQLENFDATWRYTNNPDDIYYTNVPPGKYNFVIKASNNDGVWSLPTTGLGIKIASPWYLSIWAYMFYTIGILTLLVLSRNQLIKNERLRGQVKLDHVQLEQARELSQIRSKFFTNISHEFRTPLTLIIAPLKGFLAKANDDPKRKQFKVMLRNAQRLLNLINQIMDLSKLESGHLTLEAMEQDMNQFLKQIGGVFSAYADREFVNYQINLPKKKVRVYFDRDKLDKVLANLLSNAFKFTPKYGKVELKLQVKDNHALISVSDSAKGISAKDLENIFNRFYQVKNDLKDMGTGIGLALTKELVELHKGKIEVSSTVGVGSIFLVKLPLGKNHLAENEIMEVTKASVPGDQILSIPTLEIDQDVTEDQEENTENDEKPVILIAEDNQEIREFVHDLLMEEYQVIACANGINAYSSATQHIPDLIISDIMMPEMDGYELCSNLKGDEKTSHIPVILLTAKTSVASEEQGFQLGAIYYLTKPFDPKLLLLRVRNILQNLKQYKQLVLENRSIHLEPEPVSISNADEVFIKKVLKIIEENMSNSEFQVTDLSHQLNMSKMQLYRKMKGLIGCSANEFIRTIRLKKAAMLLRQGTLSIAETTYEVGFNDLQYFRNCFKKQYGFNPSEYASKQAEIKK